MSMLPFAASLAWKDYWQEKLLSACAILGLAATLTPLLVLLGVHYGLISAMTERLLEDPRTLEITPVGSGRYDAAWIDEVRKQSGLAFIMPQTRSIAATIALRPKDGPSYMQNHTPLLASGEQDPLPARWEIPVPVIQSGEVEVNGTNLPLPGIVLSQSTAQKINAAAGDMIEGYIERNRSGKRESETLPLKVLGLLPREVLDSDAALVPLELLAALEDYRDGKAVPALNWNGNKSDDDSGEILPADVSGRVKALSDKARDRVYASFRAYASGLDDVEPLRRFFQDKHVEVYVKSAEIETVKSLDRAFTIVFALITGATVFGFGAATASSSLAGVRRKSRSIGIMRLMGFSRGGIITFPVMQALITGIFGFAAALGLYSVVAFSIDRLFAANIPGNLPVCVLPVEYGAIVFTSVLALSALASSLAAWQAANIEPSEVIRDV